MKGFFIFLFLLVGSVVAFMTYYQEIGQWYMAKVIVDEGGPYPNDTFDKLKDGNPDDFKARFDSDLGARIQIAKFADLLGKDALFVQLAEETITMYMDSPLAQKSGFDDVVFDLAGDYEDQEHYKDANALLKTFMDTYPDSKHMPEIKSEAERLKFK